MKKVNPVKDPLIPPPPPRVLLL